MNEKRMLDKHDEKVINWKEALRAREFWHDEVKETDSLTSWRATFFFTKLIFL
jgi:hypothetical protein